MLNSQLLICRIFSNIVHLENPNWSWGSSHSLCFIVFPFTQQAQILCICFSFDSFELSLLMTDFHVINLKIDFIF